MIKRSATAEWSGDLKSGNGRMRSETGAIDGAFTFASRFESGEGTNPEELVAAAHAGCFSMAFSNELDQAGFTPERVETKAHVHLEDKRIKRVKLVSAAVVPGIDAKKFEEIAQHAKENCPISKSLTAEIELDATLTKASAA